LLQATRSVPIVFAQVPDPVGAGFVNSLARPGGNAIGFITFEYGLSGKWLELLNQIAPGVTRAAVIGDPAVSAGIGQWGAIQAVAPSVRALVSPVNIRDAGEIERDVAATDRPLARGHTSIVDEQSYLAGVVEVEHRREKCQACDLVSPRPARTAAVQPSIVPPTQNTSRR
jgi:ABC transporter substrate binding protein